MTTSVPSTMFPRMQPATQDGAIALDARKGVSQKRHLQVRLRFEPVVVWIG